MTEARITALVDQMTLEEQVSLLSGADFWSLPAVEGLGLVGDHRMKKTPGSARQVTLISSEYIQQICHHTGHTSIDPRLLRRNLVISGMNMNLLRYQRLQIGEVILETSALCHPCSRMDEALGAGGTAAMFGYGGLCAKVIQGGLMRMGDAVLRLPQVGDQVRVAGVSFGQFDGLVRDHRGGLVGHAFQIDDMPFQDGLQFGLLSLIAVLQGCFDGCGNLCKLLFQHVHCGIRWLANDFVDWHGCDDGADGFADGGFIGCG